MRRRRWTVPGLVGRSPRAKTDTAGRSDGVDAPHLAATSGSKCVPFRPVLCTNATSFGRKRPVGPRRARSTYCLCPVLVRLAAVFGNAVFQRPAMAVPDSSGASRRDGSGSGRFSDSPTSGFRLRPRVLIVEDNDTTREMYAWSMRAAGWLVEEAADGEAALYAAVLFEPDVIVMDLRLPGLDGIEATRRLRETELTRDIPIVACSALNRAEDAKNAGCSAFVTKPCPPEDLRALVESLAGNRAPSDPIE